MPQNIATTAAPAAFFAERRGARGFASALRNVVTLAAVALALGAGAPPRVHAADAAVPAAAETPDAERLTRIAQLLAGIEPSAGDPAIDHVVASKAWQQHRAASSAGIKQVRTRVERMQTWGRAHITPASTVTAPSSTTLIYPFSGPDFFNAYALFPDYDTYVFFSLEPPGTVPDATRLSPAQWNGLLRDLRAALNDVVLLNFFITPHMEKGMKTDSLSGITPVLLSMMAVLDLRVLALEPYDPWPERTAAYAKPGAKKPAMPMQAIRVDFAGRSGKRQQLIYFALDVSDRALPQYPEFMPWLRKFEQPTVFMKSASYLLHGVNFKQTAAFVREQAALLVQDDTGMPFRSIQDAGFKVSLHGQYERPVQLFENRYQKDLAAAFATAGDPAPVPFPFGYNWRREGKSFVIVARHPRVQS